MPPHIRIVGSLNIDYTTITPRFPGPGETLTAKSLAISAGGKGANQAVACARASHASDGHRVVKVEMVGAVGAKNGQYSGVIKPVLEESGVDCSGILELEDAQTGTATIIVDEAQGGENRILVVPGANYEGMKDSQAVVERALVEPLPEVFVLQGEIPRETTFALLSAIAKKSMEQTQKKAEIVFNPAPVYQEGIPVDILKCVTHLIVNETEMGQLAVEAGEQYHVAETEHQKRLALVAAANIFHGRQVRNVVITRGAEGVFCSSPGGSFHLEAARASTVADTTSAGDTFVGYYAVEVAKQIHARGEMATSEILKQACRRATKAAAMCVAREGAIESIPWACDI